MNVNWTTFSARLRLQLPLIALLAWLGPVAAPPAAADSSAAPTVILLSLDGLRHDYMDRGEFPALQRLAAAGVRAQRLRGVYPTDTFPSHISLATGTYPDRHGIVGNHFFDRTLGTYFMSPQTQWLDAEPLWIAAERQGVRAATYFWVGSEQDWRDQRPGLRMAPFDGQRPERQKAAQILAWLQLPAAQRPRLIMSYWAGVDRVAHRRGPDSRAIVRQLHIQDEALAVLLTGLDELGRWDTVTLLLVSDHGMTLATDYLPVREALNDAGIGARMFGAAVAHVFLEQPEQRAQAKTVIEAVHPAIEVHFGDQLPGRWRLQRADRTGDLVVAVPPPYVLSWPGGIAGWLTRTAGRLGWAFGGHGYDPALEDMGATFLAMGRGVPQGVRLGEVRMIDVAATVSALLQIDAPGQSEGRVIDFDGGRR